MYTKQETGVNTKQETRVCTKQETGVYTKQETGVFTKQETRVYTEQETGVYTKQGSRLTKSPLLLIQMIIGHCIGHCTTINIPKLILQENIINDLTFLKSL